MFTVVWSRAATEQIAKLWNTSGDQFRRAMVATIWQFERDLRRDPTNSGESREGVERVHLVRPLGVLFDVYEE